MAELNLDKFYKQVEKIDLNEEIFIRKPDMEGGLFNIIKAIGSGSNSYVFLARDGNKKFVVFRMSYKKADFTEKFDTLVKEMGDDYKHYLLELLYISLPINHYFIRGDSGEDEKVFFDKEVFISTWEPANVTLKEKLTGTFQEKLVWFLQFLKGLSIIHSRGRIHLDIKLDNLFLVKGQLKIGDFEFYLKEEAFQLSNLLLCGTNGHIAPEVFYDRKKVSTKADIFSSGIAFIQLFTGIKLSDIKYLEEIKDEENKLKEFFGSRHLEITDDAVYEDFKKNFRVFYFFRQELDKKLANRKIPEIESFTYHLLDRMIEIKPGKRIDVSELLFKMHERVFDPGLLLGNELLGRYQVQRLLDRKGRGFIFQVQDMKTGLIQAIKLFPPQYNFIKYEFNQIKNELIKSINIAHKNVIRVHGLECEDDLNFIIMEYIQGLNLKKKLLESKKGNKLKETEALEIMEGVASGLIEIHRKGIIHKNLKASNIMLDTKEGCSKIINFGLSLDLKKEISKITNAPYSSKESMLIQTPEQIRGIMDMENEQTDVWQFGNLLYQMLTGKIPFDAADKKRDPKTIPPITGISNKTKAVILKCLEKDRDKRYRNMKEVYDDLFKDKEKEVKPEKERQGLKQLIDKRIFSKISVLVVIVVILTIIFGPNLFKGSDEYMMWYSGNPGDSNTPSGGIGYAESTDGFNWQRDRNNLVIPHGETGTFNEFESAYPYILYDGGFYHMLFRGKRKEGNNFEFNVGYLKSQDGKTWNTENIEIIFDNGNIKSPGPLLYIESKYKMWYTDNGNINYAATEKAGDSLLEMVRYSGNPVIRKGEAGNWSQDGLIVGSVLLEKKKYKMWYTGISGDESRIGYVTSSDGINWNLDPGNPITIDEEIEFNMHPCVIRDSKGYKMYYTIKDATSGTEYFTVRLATSPDGINWKRYSNLPSLDVENDWEGTKVFATTVRLKDK